MFICPALNKQGHLPSSTVFVFSFIYVVIYSTLWLFDRLLHIINYIHNPFLFVSCAGNWTWSFIRVRQVFYQWVLFSFVLFSLLFTLIVLFHDADIIKLFIFIINIWVCLCLWRPKENVGFSRAGVVSGCVPPHVGSDPLEKHKHS